MQITETSAEGLKREFKVVVAAADIEQKVTSRLKELSQTVRMPGFRPGKVPMSMLKKRFGQHVMGEVLEQAKQVAADLLEAAVEDVVYEPTLTHFHVVGTPAVSRTLADVAAAAPEGLAAQVDYQGSSPTFPFGAHIAVVEIDTETGKVRLRRLVAVDDAGRILNPLLAEGQVHGGLAQGIAQALFEEVRYDEDGNPITSNLADYAFVSAAELPSFETVHMETPTPVNELGAKGIGESGTIGATPAVQNAVVDALAHLGVRHLDMPATPERVWRAIAQAGGG